MMKGMKNVRPEDRMHSAYLLLDAPYIALVQNCC